MYIKSAKFYDALYHFKNYEEAAANLHTQIMNLHPRATSLLDVGCGTGNHLEFLRRHYRVEGLDLNPDLIEVARDRCPDVPLHVADMLTFSLEHSFDVITCLFSSIAYVKTLSNLNQAVSQMAAHLNQGGLLFVEPWVSPENYWLGRITANFVDQAELKIAWMYTSEIEGTVSIFDINYLVGTPEGVSYFTERHEMGLFTVEEYKEAFCKAGLEVEFDPKGLFNRGLYTARKK